MPKSKILENLFIFHVLTRAVFVVVFKFVPWVETVYALFKVQSKKKEKSILLMYHSIPLYHSLCGLYSNLITQATHCHPQQAGYSIYQTWKDGRLVNLELAIWD